MESKKIAVVQSNYIPWKGYFDLINLVDEFILFDDMQYTRRDWRNRNKIITPDGLLWLTIPVLIKGKYNQKINETRVSEKDWGKKHWETICYYYSKAKYFKNYNQYFEKLFMDSKVEFLSLINFNFITLINKLLGIKTKISWSSEYNLVGDKTKRLIDLCKQTNATEYISGPLAKSYIQEGFFSEENIKLIWMDYTGYPEYKQLYLPFEHGVSIIDLIFNEGPEATRYMKSFHP
jgi:hypothetical protein